MIYDRLRLLLILRIILLSATIGFSFYTYYRSDFILTTLSLVLLSLLQVFLLIRSIDKTNKQLSSFFDSVVYDDFTQHFSAKVKNPSLRELYQALNKVNDLFKRQRKEAEETRHFLSNIIQHIGIGIIAYDENGQVELMNNACKKILLSGNIRSIHQIPAPFSDICYWLLNLGNEEKALVKTSVANEAQEWHIYVSWFRLGNRKMKIASIQNIGSELAEKELQSWQNMMRVLTHEIMNSITPITSLSATVNEWLEQEEEPANHSSDEDIKQAMRTIERRSYGLLKFVDNFRTLTRLPDPEPMPIAVQELLNGIQVMMGEELKDKNTHFSCSCDPGNLQIVADPGMIEQVLLNLCLNAAQASEQAAEPRVEVKAFIDNRSKINIAVSDNGAGIPLEARDKIFIPFFSTKKHGSGIGLSLSRQIMKKHGGSIFFESVPGTGSTFTIRFL